MISNYEAKIALFTLQDAVRKMLKLAGPTIGLTEESVSAKSKEGKAEQVRFHSPRFRFDLIASLTV